uniref:Ku domain-containing protein n=1 Tax=Rhabditophanes sp. KR3021 TaxID=114890 RepID=A0AC35U926_9BILA
MDGSHIGWGNVSIFFDCCQLDPIYFQKQKHFMSRFIKIRQMMDCANRIDIGYNVKHSTEPETVIKEDCVQTSFDFFGDMEEKLIAFGKEDCQLGMIGMFNRRLAAVDRNVETFEPDHKFIIVSDFSSYINGGSEEVDKFAKSCEKAGCKIIFVGLKDFYSEVKRECPLKGEWCDVLSVEEGIANIQFYHIINKATRGTPYALELNDQHKINIVDHVVLVKPKEIMSFKKVLKEIGDEESTTTYKRKFAKIDDEGNEIPKENIINAFKFGVNIIPINHFDEIYHGTNSEAKSFQFIQFAKSKDIHLSFLVGESHMIMPKENDKPSFKRMLALNMAMIESDVVMITRKVYSKASAAKMVVMFPRINETTNMPYFVNFNLPFSQDVRSLVFPNINDWCDGPSTNEEDVMNEVVDRMTLGREDKRFLPKQTNDPNLQMKYETIVDKFTGVGRDVQEIRDIIKPIYLYKEFGEENKRKLNEALKARFPITTPQEEKLMNELNQITFVNQRLADVERIKMEIFGKVDQILAVKEEAHINDVAKNEIKTEGSL